MYRAASDSERMIRPLAIARGSVTVAALTTHPYRLAVQATAYHCLNRGMASTLFLIYRPQKDWINTYPGGASL
jgi:hypothetical protein